MAFFGLGGGLGGLLPPGLGGVVDPATGSPAGLPDPSGAGGEYPSLGASLMPAAGEATGSPAGLPVQADPAAGGMPVSLQGAAAPAPGSGIERALAGLRGVVAPAKPNAVIPSTPRPIPPVPIKGGELFSLLEQLGNFRKPVPTGAMSLGQSLSGR